MTTAQTASETEPESAELTVLMVPMPGSYETELVTELESQGARVWTHEEGPFRILGGIRAGGVPDVIHLHFLHQFVSRTRFDTSLVSILFSLRLLFELVVARALGVRLVWTVHNLVGHESSHERVERVARHLVVRLCHRVIVHCDTARDRIVEQYRLPVRLRSRIRTVPHGNYDPRYPNEVTKREARDRLGVAPDARTLVFFGRIRPYKNVTALLRSFRGVDAPEARLVIAGNPFDEKIRERVEKLAAADDRVRTRLAFVPDEEVQLYMQAADVTVFPYRSVLTSGGVILGMTFGRPVVAPTEGCVGELLDSDGGFPYDPTEPSGLQRALERAVTADLDGMGEHNRSRVEPLQWRWIAAQTLGVYRN